MTKGYITFVGMDYPAVLIAEADGEKTPIAELYQIGEKLFLLLWRKPNESGWYRKVYKRAESAETAITKRLDEYMGYLWGKEYELHNRIVEL